MVTILLGGLGLLLAYYLIFLVKDLYAHRNDMGDGNYITF